MRRFLRYDYRFREEDILTLKGREATLENIQKSFEELRQKASRHHGDTVIVILFAGHGWRIPDQNGDEATRNPGDKWDEIYCPYDFEYRTRANALVDDDLGDMLDSLEAVAANLVVIHDTCHSGGAARSVGVVSRALPADDSSNVGPTTTNIR